MMMRHNVLQFRDGFWRMNEEAAMSNALSPLLAEVFLANYENELKLDQRFPRDWKRYVDDVFAVVNARQANNVLDFLNEASQSANIKFTMEREENE